MCIYIHSLLSFSLILLLLCGCENKQTQESNSSETKDIQIDSLLTQRIDSCVQRLTPKHKTAVYVYDLTADKPVYGYHEK
ncbi:MAG: peptidase, partial [Bacteroidaceae bacterium]|nr:peptidase [Bacteroidaceae bacterium]